MNKKFTKIISIMTVFAMLFTILPEFAIEAFAEEKKNLASSSVSSEENPDEELDMSRLKEVKKERTSNTKTFTDSNGSFYKEIYPEAIHTKEDTGYEEISENLTSTGTGYVSTENTNLEASFPQSIKKDSEIIYKKDNHELTFQLESAKKDQELITPTLNTTNDTQANKSTFQNIYPQIDLRHITFNDEVKEDWIVNEYTGIHTFNYTMKTDLTPALESNGSITFKEADKVIFTLPRPTMMDSNINEEKGEGVYSNKVHYELEETATNTYALTLEADDEWLSSDKRVYPVYIDPSVTATALGDTYVSSKYPTANFNKKWDATQGEYVLQTGYYDSTSGTNYAYIKFDINDLKGATIDNAQLSTYVTHAYYKAEQNGLWVDAVNDIWYTASLNWNNKPSSTKITSVNVGRDEWANFNVTDTVQSWMSGETRNNGFKLHTNGHGKTYWKKISAAENTNKPKIVVKYHYEAGPKPTVSATAYNDGSNNGYTNVKWNAVYGATGYKLLMYDGAAYKEVYTGTATSWSSKGKKIFPKSPYTTSSTYVTDGSGVELPNDPSTFFAKKGTADYLYYKFRVVPTFATGDGTQSEFSRVKIPKETKVVTDAPDQPTIVGHQYSETSNNKGRGWLDISWNKVDGATSYKVLIWNGTKYDTFNVGNKTSVTTKGKKIYPTDDEIAAGTLDFHQASLADTSNIGTGAELPMYPGKSYNNTSKRYSVRIVAVSDAGDSARSEIAYGFIPLYAPKSADVTLKANEDDLVENKTTLTASWKNNELATLYDVTIKGEKSKFNKTYRVKATSGDTTTYTPSATFDLDDTYEVYVQPYFYDSQNAPSTEADDSSLDDVKRGISPMPTEAQATVTPDLKEDLIGLEDYFTYEEQSFGNATANVNVTTGNMAVQFTDESLYTRGDLGYDFTRTYNSRSTKNSALGKGWTFVGNESLSEDKTGNILYSDEDGTRHTFSKDGAKYVSPKGLYETLNKVNDTTYTMTDTAGFVQTYQKAKNSTDFLIESYQDEYSNKIVFKRNDQDQVTVIEEEKGTSNQEKIQISYNAEKQIEKVKYGEHFTTFTYTNNQLTKTTIGSEKTQRTITETFEYDATGKLVKYIDGKNNETTFEYSKNTLVIFDKQAEDAELSVTNTFEFDTKENQFVVKDSSDEETVYKRDEANNTFAVAEVNAPGEDSQNTRTFYTFDDQYNVLEVINPDGSTETNTFDSSGNLLTSTTKDGTATNTYNDKNQLIKTIAETGEETTYVYDGAALVSTTTKDGTTQFENDSFGRVTKTIYVNDTFEEVVYDDTNRQVTSTDKKGNTTSVSYSIYNQTLQETDASGHKKSYTYDPLYLDTMTSVTDGNGNKTSYTYDDNNNLTTLTDALNRQKSYVYNDNDQVTSVKMPTMEFKYSYDLNGELSSAILPSGIETNYTYNSDGQVSQIDNGNDIVTYEYDENGNISAISRNNEALKTFTYEAETNALATYTLGLFSQKYEYDETERLIKNQTVYNDETAFNQEITYKENSDDVNQLKYSLDGTNTHTYTVDTDIANNQTTLTLNADLLVQVAQTNDSNLLSSLVYTTKQQTPFEINYEYTKNGNISKETINNDVNSFEYDQNDQLIKETLSDGTINSYEYDAVGNRTQSDANGIISTFTYNDANQIKMKNDTAFEYDKDGNLLQDENYKYTYNQQQRLTQVKTLEGNPIASYTYDEDGLRLTKTVGDTTHEYFYNNEVLDMEVVKVNDIVTEYRSYEWSGYTPLGMIVKTKNDANNFETKAYQFITNHRGDVLSIRDSEDNEVGSYTYDAYGNILAAEGTLAKANPIRYAGYYYDEETNNYYLQARYYNPANGSFLALDPHPGDEDDPLSQNGYSYANGNPVMNVDPDGNSPIWVIQALLLPVLVYFAKKYGANIFKKYAKKALKSKLQPIVNKHLKNYKVSFFPDGEVIFKIVKKHKGRLFSFDYGYIPYKEKGRSKKQIRIKSYHYHINYKPMHNVYRWNKAYWKGYKLYHKKNYRWVWV